jgi:hypothetical protein
VRCDTPLQTAIVNRDTKLVDRESQRRDWLRELHIIASYRIVQNGAKFLTTQMNCRRPQPLGCLRDLVGKPSHVRRIQVLHLQVDEKRLAFRPPWDVMLSAVGPDELFQNDTQPP